MKSDPKTMFEDEKVLSVEKLVKPVSGLPEESFRFEIMGPPNSPSGFYSLINLVLPAKIA